MVLRNYQKAQVQFAGLENMTSSCQRMLCELNGFWWYFLVLLPMYSNGISFFHGPTFSSAFDFLMRYCLGCATGSVSSRGYLHCGSWYSLLTPGSTWTWMSFSMECLWDVHERVEKWISQHQANTFLHQLSICLSLYPLIYLVVIGIKLKAFALSHWAITPKLPLYILF